jgi:phage terminase small subunit
MGRNAQPVDLLQAKGLKHLTKSEIEERKKSEIKLGSAISVDSLVCPQWLKSDQIAYEKWNEVLQIYSGWEFVSSSDVNLIARYCKTHSEYIDLLKHRDKISDIEPFSDDENDEIIIFMGEEMGARRAKAVLNKLEYIFTLSGVLAIDKAINAKMDALRAMEDRLFLNPLAKVKVKAPKIKEEDKKDPLEEKGFGNV